MPQGNERGMKVGIRLLKVVLFGNVVDFEDYHDAS